MTENAEDFPMPPHCERMCRRLKDALARFRGGVLVEPKENGSTLKIWTRENQYTFSMREPAGHDNGYLGGGMSKRAPYPGETWTRGRDLSDGPLTEDTLVRILGDIVSCEMEPLSPPQPAASMNCFVGPQPENASRPGFVGFAGDFASGAQQGPAQ